MCIYMYIYIYICVCVYIYILAGALAVWGGAVCDRGRVDEPLRVLEEQRGPGGAHHRATRRHHFARFRYCFTASLRTRVRTCVNRH